MPGRKLLLHNCGPTTGLPGQSTTKPGRFWFSVPRPKVSHEPRLGRIGCMLPEFIISSDGSWFGLSVYIERSTQSSSMQAADVGKKLGDLDAALALWLSRERRGHDLALAFARTGSTRRRAGPGRRIS